MVEQIEVADAAVLALNLRRDELADIELQLFLDALSRYGGYDFRNFNQSVLRRRIADSMRAEQIATISGLQDRLLHDERALATFVVSMSGGPSELFHDPLFFKALSAHVIPLLQTYSFIRIWVPGSGTGGDAYSLAAILDEAGILGKAVIYATCIDDVTAAVAKAGFFEHRSVSDLTALARQAGIVQPLHSYFEVHEHFAVPNARIRENVMFARHNPVEDGSINEFHAIIARNLLPLYNGAVQYRMHKLFFDSLMHLGFLALGHHETLTNTVHERAFRNVLKDQPIFRRMR
ncbi:MAG TPA: CheR family methyltransferase [Candidatus Baltobacteraceae bacterium]|nr:CheR family methyltransferase [Candidatus Baltobacteraceae bacterium]